MTQGASRASSVPKTLRSVADFSERALQILLEPLAGQAPEDPKQKCSENEQLARVNRNQALSEKLQRKSSMLE